MKIALIPQILLLGATIAAPLDHTKRDLRVINYNVDRLSKTLRNLDVVLTRRPGNDARSQDNFFRNVLDLNANVIRELRDGAADIRKGPNINDAEAIQLGVQTTPLVLAIRNVMNDWISVKRQAVQINADRAVLDGLVQAQTSSNSFNDAIISKLTPLSRVSGEAIKTTINRDIDRATREYRRR